MDLPDTRNRQEVVSRQGYPYQEYEVITGSEFFFEILLYFLKFWFRTFQVSKSFSISSFSTRVGFCF
jgi:hypothetical protein